jgi:drug/metabolite transporter (DMT)-like permease
VTAHIPVSFLLPLGSAIVYVAGALLLKRAGELGVHVWQIAWRCNVTAAIAFTPLLLFGGTLRPIDQWWQPAVVALLFVLGQLFTFRSLRFGDVSVATPVLGVKIILVALFTTIVLRERLTSSLWIAAVLATVAIGLLQVTRGKNHHHVGSTIVAAGMAALAYALFDVLVQKWSPAWGLGRFLPIMMGFVVLFSIVPRVRFGRRETAATPEAMRWLFGGAVCLGLQSVMFVSTIAMFGQAAVANVVYSTRGLWSVLAVWLVGHWFHNREQHLGRRILTWRLCGAALLLTAVVLVLLNGREKKTPEPRKVVTQKVVAQLR